MKEIAERRNITFEMIKGTIGIKEYKIIEDGEEIFRFNNPKMTIIFLLKRLFPDEPEHTFNPFKPNPEVEQMIEKYLGDKA